MLLDRSARVELGFRVRRAVRWMSPFTWVATLAAVAVGWFRHQPTPESHQPRPTPSPDPASDGAVWVDFVSDTGDGFAATATVAWLLAQDHLELPDGSTTQRGSLLAHGGDMVYPSGSDRAYADRYVGPMAAMLPAVEGAAPTLAAIPGNHDAHDGLVAWRRLMLAGRRIGAWKTAQSEPWFATQLSDRWWLWGVDVESNDDLGPAQWDYFAAMADRMPSGASVIIVVSEPAWVRADQHGRRETYRRLVEELVEGQAGGRVRLWLSGDSHHYCRYVGAGDSVHYVIAGGGGAFLSATHSIPTHGRLGGESIEVVEESIYPARAVSRDLVRRAPTLLWRNGPFPLVAALVYGIAGLALGSERMAASVFSAAFIAVALGIALAAWLYTADRGWRGAAVGVTHAFAHLVAIVCFWWLFDWGGPAGLLAVAGAVVGPLIIGSALRVASNLGLNANELFSAIRVDDYRSFVRLRVDGDGGIVVYAIGVDRVARRWMRADSPDRSVPAERPVLEPTQPVAVRLIDRFRIPPLTGEGD